MDEHYVYDLPMQVDFSAHKDDEVARAWLYDDDANLNQ